MTKWEYDKIDLNAIPRHETEISILNLAGASGWELVAINACNIAIMKRALPAARSARSAPAAAPAARSK